MPHIPGPSFLQLQKIWRHSLLQLSAGPTEAMFRGLCSVKIIVTWEKRDILLQPSRCGQKNLLPARNDGDAGQRLITSSVSWLTLCAVICCCHDSFLLQTRSIWGRSRISWTETSHSCTDTPHSHHSLSSEQTPSLQLPITLSSPPSCLCQPLTVCDFISPQLHLVTCGSNQFSSILFM